MRLLEIHERTSAVFERLRTPQTFGKPSACSSIRFFRNQSVVFPSTAAHQALLPYSDNVSNMRSGLLTFESSSILPPPSFIYAYQVWAPPASICNPDRHMGGGARSEGGGGKIPVRRPSSRPSLSRVTQFCRRNTLVHLECGFRPVALSP